MAVDKLQHLSDVEKTLVMRQDRPWTDNGDGTLTTPDGKRYDHDAGDSFMDRYNLSSDYQPPAPPAFDPNRQEVPMMHVEYKRDANGNIQKDASGKNIVTSFGVRYSDGTISYTGAGREGVLEAERQRSRIKMYNQYVNDDRTAEDFDTREEYNNHITNKNIRIAQGQYSYITDLQGNSTLKAPNGAVLSIGSLDDIRKEFGSRASTLSQAMDSLSRGVNQTYDSNEKRYIMENKGFTSDQEFNAFIKEELQKRVQRLNNIYMSWDQAAADQGIVSTGQKNYYTFNIPDLTNFVPAVVESNMSYTDWYKQNITGGLPPEEEQLEEDKGVEQTIVGTEGGTGQPSDGEQAGGTDATGTPVAVGNTGQQTTTTGGFYQPFVQTPTATTTTVPGYQTVEGVYPTSGTATTGTTTTPAATTTSAVPETINYYTNYTGTTDANLTSASQGGLGAIKQYRNKYTGQIIMVQLDANGNPMTYVPAAFEPVDATSTTEVQQQQEQRGSTSNLYGAGATEAFADGGSVESKQNEALYTIAKMNGYNGPKSGTALKAFFNSSDALKAKARAIGVAMAKGGAVLYANDGVDVQTGQEGVDVQPGVTLQDDSFATQLAGQTKSLIGETMAPMQAGVSYIQPESADFIDDTAGQAYYQAPMQEAETVLDITQAGVPQVAPTSTMTPATVSDQVQTTTEGLTAVQGTLGKQSQVDAATMQKQKIDPVTGQLMFDAQGNPIMESDTSVSGLTAATGTATEVGVRQKADPETGELMFDAQGNPIMEKVLPKRTLQEQIVDPVTGEVIQQGELITGTGVDQTKVDETFGTGEVAAASVQDELAGLMAQFEGGDTPAWAAGSMRKATQMLAARGLGASSLAGQAVIQAAMEAALPIAQIDAGNKQQMALFKAEQRAKFLGMEFDQAFQAKVMNATRVSEIANINFNAEQQVALENSRAANTMNLQNLSNKQALIMAEAAALSQLDMANLNNRQQAAVQNAQNFLQMDMANLNNEQQTALFKAQQNIQALFTDQAAENAAAQFNATSENQANQFFANLTSQVGQFNAAQQNAMNQFNVNSVNAMREFNGELQQQRDLFNAQNGLVVAQANAQWRQNIATLNQAAQNESNMNFAKSMNAFTSTNLDAYWQRERDVMSFAFTSAENAADRLASVLLEKLSADNKTALADEMGKGALGATLLKGALNYMAGGVIVR